MFTAVTGQEAVDLRKMDPSRRLRISLAQERKIPEQGRIKPTAGSGKDADKAVQTGDSSQILWGVVLVAACVAAGAEIAIRKRRERDK